MALRRSIKCVFQEMMKYLSNVDVGELCRSVKSVLKWCEGSNPFTQTRFFNMECNFYDYLFIKIIMIIKNCLNCLTTFEAPRKRNKFCSVSCSSKFHSKTRSRPDVGEKISASLKKAWAKIDNNFSKGEKHATIVSKFTKGKYNKNPESIFDLSSRTMHKIIKRLNLPCSHCGWKEGTCDIHHINGRKIENANRHDNLSCICPNCHRLVHEGKIKKESLKNLCDYIGNRWKDVYYG